METYVFYRVHLFFPIYLVVLELGYDSFGVSDRTLEIPHGG